jgi:hypothetical protein
VTFDPSRSTPHGYWRFAAEYYLAGEAAHQARPALWAPILQLYGQSLELALKAFLLKRGVPPGRVRALSHGVAETLALARKRKLGTCVKLAANDLALINLLSASYSAHRFRYIETGATQLPNPDFMAGIVYRVVDGLEMYCTGCRWGVHRRDRSKLP